MKLTHEMLHEMCKCGCPNGDQMKLLGLTPPLTKGWLARLEGLEISKANWERILAFRGLSQGQRKRVLRLEKQAELL